MPNEVNLDTIKNMALLGTPVINENPLDMVHSCNDNDLYICIESWNMLKK